MKPASTLTLAFVTMLLAAPAAAQTTTTANPGLIGPGSALHSFDVSLDTTLVQWGVKPPGQVAAERASEALEAQQRNLTQARERALNGLDAAVKRANGVADSSGLEQAQTILKELKTELPDDAQDGIQTAIDQVIEAQNRFPTDTPATGQPDGNNPGNSVDGA